MLSCDQRLTVWHTSILFAIIQLSTDNEIFGQTIMVTRGRIMRLAHIKSAMTYHKCMNQLQQYGYIFYMPSYHPGEGSRVLLLRK